MKRTRINLGEFRILGASAIGKSQRKVVEDCGIAPNIGYKIIKKLERYGIFTLTNGGGNKQVQEKVTLFHRYLGEIMVDMANREDVFFQKFGNGSVIDSYVPIVLAAMIKPSVDAIISGGKTEVKIDELENLAALLKGVIYSKIRKEGTEHEIKKTIEYFETLGKEIKNGNSLKRIQSRKEKQWRLI